MEDHWEKTRKSINMMSVVIYSLVCALGVLGNGVVIWATGFRLKKTVSTVWYLNLAVADFLVTAFLPLSITTRALNGQWPFGWFICMMDIVVFHVNMYASILILVVISVDRCVCPVWAVNHRTVRKASWVSLGVWVLALALSSPHVISKEYHGVCYPDYPDLPTVVTNSVVGVLVLFVATVSCYSVIISHLRSNNHSQSRQSGRSSSYKIIATVIVVFFLCWAPYHIVWLIFALRYPVSMSHRLDHRIQVGISISHALALLDSCLNPLLYVFVAQGFKDVFRSSRSILKVLEKAFAEEPTQTNASKDPAVTTMIALTDIEETLVSLHMLA